MPLPELNYMYGDEWRIQTHDLTTNRCKSSIFQLGGSVYNIVPVGMYCADWLYECTFQSHVSLSFFFFNINPPKIHFSN